MWWTIGAFALTCAAAFPARLSVATSTSMGSQPFMGNLLCFRTHAGACRGVSSSRAGREPPSLRAEPDAACRDERAAPWFSERREVCLDGRCLRAGRVVHLGHYVAHGTSGVCGPLVVLSTRRGEPVPRKRTSVKRILNCEPSRNTEQDWLVEHARRSRAVAAGAPVPASKDLRTSWWRIGDQGMTGSCVGWALADSVLRWHFVKAGRLAQTQPLSPRYLWMASKETDPITDRPTTFIDAEGTTLKSALDVAQEVWRRPRHGPPVRQRTPLRRRDEDVLRPGSSAEGGDVLQSAAGANRTGVSGLRRRARS